ncbi:MAG: aminoglycoside 6-adenylyltransferase [Clostridia bacterium]
MTKMRNEEQMMNLILNFAENNEKIRAVYMNGSRTNPNIKKDIYQDYDIVYVVTDVLSFVNNKSFIHNFGEIAIVQEPCSAEFAWGDGMDYSKFYNWLILFKDGNRIDLTLQSIPVAIKEIIKDSLVVTIMDKDNILPKLPVSNDSNYIISKPSLEEFNGCCNEFWWCLNNVGKGIMRGELVYYMDMYNKYVRDMLIKMLEWNIACEHDFKISTGKCGKFFADFCDDNQLKLIQKTYSNDIWESVFYSCELFSKSAKKVGKALKYKYNQNDEQAIIDYLNNLKNNEYFM